MVQRAAAASARPCPLWGVRCVPPSNSSSSGAATAGRRVAIAAGLPERREGVMSCKIVSSHSEGTSRSLGSIDLPGQLRRAAEAKDDAGCCAKLLLSSHAALLAA